MRQWLKVESSDLPTDLGINIGSATEGGRRQSLLDVAKSGFSTEPSGRFSMIQMNMTAKKISTLALLRQG
jgi:hypothetical protein